MFKKTIVAAVALTAALSASAATSGPTFNLKEWQTSNGQKAFKAECYGVFESSSSCMAAAKKACGDQPVNVLQTVDGMSTSSNPHELVFSCGRQAQSAPASEAEPAPLPVEVAPVTPAPIAPAAVSRSVTLDEKTNFAFDSAELTPKARRILNKVVADGRDVTFSTVTVAGFTDSVGSAPYNVALSERRANAVLGYLKAHGLKSSNFSTSGFGKEKPAASNATAPGRAENRRVEIVLTQ